MTGGALIIIDKPHHIGRPTIMIGNSSGRLRYFQKPFVLANTLSPIKGHGSAVGNPLSVRIGKDKVPL